MTSERQIRSNRRNAQLSRGPVSDEGKRISSRNALTHGLTSRTLILEGEDPKAFIALSESLFHEFRPVGILENILVERLVSAVWRLGRAATFEAAYLKSVQNRKGLQSARRSPIAAKQMGLLGEGGSVDNLGEVVAALLQTDVLGKLDRHERSLTAEFTRVLQELRSTQAARAINHSEREEK